MSTEIHALFAEEPLTATEARLLGSLIEKQATTPEAYPLTLNALVLASNQKTSREPVMNLNPGQAGQGMRSLEARGLARLVMGSRADRWEQRADKTLELVQPQLILIGLLLLRGPQTLSELLTRSNRMADFDDTEHVRHQLERLIGRGLATLLPRQSGQREDRYMHLMGDPADLEALLEARASMPERAESRAAADARIDELEARVAELEARLARLEQAD
ncbi:YceH family protein [Pseudomonas boanensis]|uniref:YceH family protein n=1 Tax=Metapseudomonas boanensis TaxID=2822138 RepID=UPI0035D46A2F